MYKIFLPFSNLVSDALQRTCTGTIIVNLEGGGWKGPESTTIRVIDRDKPELTTVDTFKNTVGIETRLPVIRDNVHFGPAGIGLLIMGFLVLGCKYFNSSIPMYHTSKIVFDLLNKCILQMLILFNYQDISRFGTGLIKKKKNPAAWQWRRKTLLH